jgi:uncharacterized protein
VRRATGRVRPHHPIQHHTAVERHCAHNYQWTTDYTGAVGAALTEIALCAARNYSKVFTRPAKLRRAPSLPSSRLYASNTKKVPAMAEIASLTYQVTKVPSEGVTLKGTIPFAALDIADEERFACPQPLSFDLRLAPLGPDILVTGKLHAVINCVCDRCDGHGELAIASDEVCHRYLNVAGQVLDLTADIREDILIAFPQRYLCSESCRGICPHCGQNRNREACRCAEGQADAAEDANPWSALDDLKL